MKFSEKRTIDGGYFSSISTDDGKPLVVRVNGVKAVGSVEKANDAWFSVDEDPFEAIGAEVYQDLNANTEKWFGRQVGEKTIKASWKPITTDGQFFVSVPEAATFFEAETKAIVDDAIADGATCDILVQVKGVWLSKRDVLVSLKLQQARVHPEEKPKEEIHDDWMMEPSYGFDDE